MVVDVDLGALRRPHPVHKSAPKGSPKTLKIQPEFSQVESWPMCLVHSWNLLGASCWLIHVMDGCMDGWIDGWMVGWT